MTTPNEDSLARKRARKAAWQKANKEKHAARNRARRAANPEKVRAYEAAWKKANHERVRACAAEWYRNNRERAGEFMRAWRDANPESVRAYRTTRRARNMGAEGTFTQQDVLAILKRQMWWCAGCGTSLRDAFHVDHVTPLARGGSNHPWNLQMLCPSCNLRKGAKDNIEFFSSLFNNQPEGISSC